jgi:hypothetical protein
MSFEQRLIRYKEDARLESALVQWAREYGKGPADHLGYASQNALHRLGQHAGWLPPPEPVRAPTRTESDTVESIVRLLEKGEGWKHAQVLRLDYYEPKLAMDSRLKRLRQVGVICSKDGYCTYLETAKEFVRVKMFKIF